MFKSIAGVQGLLKGKYYKIFTSRIMRMKEIGSRTEMVKQKINPPTVRPITCLATARTGCGSPMEASTGLRLLTGYM